MTKRHNAKYKLDRRMGENVWGRPKSPVNRREYGPGQHGQRRKSKLSDYGVQLKAKQKLRGYYGNISEKQFRGIYTEARRLKGDSGAHMIGLLERRLDALIFRAKFVPTVFAARQFINHGHIKVNGKRVNISSFRVKVGDVVEVKEFFKADGAGRRSAGPGRARRARLHRCRRLETHSQADAHSATHRRALRGADGAASGGRVLFALIRATYRNQKTPAARQGFLFVRCAVAQAVCLTTTPFSLSVCCSSPAWNISRTMSQPPTNSPLT